MVDAFAFALASLFAFISGAATFFDVIQAYAPFFNTTAIIFGLWFASRQRTRLKFLEDVVKKNVNGEWAEHPYNL